MHVETRVNNCRYSTQLIIFAHDAIKTGVGFFANEFRTRSTVNMDRGGTIAFHEVGAIKRDRHEFRRFFCTIQILMASVAFVEKRRPCKWYKFGSAQTLIKPLVNLGSVEHTR
jgi:hypothetical protein